MSTATPSTPSGTPTSQELLAALLDEHAPHQDLLDVLRPDALRHLRAVAHALYNVPQSLPVATLRGLAAVTAQWQGSDDLIAWHRAHEADVDLLDNEAPQDSLHTALRDLVDILTVSPSLARSDDHRRALDAGARPEMLVLVGHLVGFESVLLRVHALLAVYHGIATGHTPAPQRTPRSRTRANRHGGTTETGQPRPAHFTRGSLEWEPWLEAPSAEDLTEQQRASFAAKAGTGSVYFRLPSLTPEVTAERSALDNAIFRPRDRSQKAERELAATVTSRVNDCIYCASVHSRKAAALARAEDAIDTLLDAPVSRDVDAIAEDLQPLQAGQSARWQAIIAAAAELSRPRPRLTAAHLDQLRALGLADDEIVDILSGAAFFAWANRLMLGLGDAIKPEAA